MKNKLTANEIKNKMAVIMAELNSLPVDAQAEVLKKIQEAKRNEFLNDAHLLDWVRNEIAWQQAFEQ